MISPTFIVILISSIFTGFDLRWHFLIYIFAVLVCFVSSNHQSKFILIIFAIILIILILLWLYTVSFNCIEHVDIHNIAFGFGLQIGNSQGFLLGNYVLVIRVLGGCRRDLGLGAD